MSFQPAIPDTRAGQRGLTSVAGVDNLTADTASACHCELIEGSIIRMICATREPRRRSSVRYQGAGPCRRRCIGRAASIQRQQSTPSATNECTSVQLHIANGSYIIGHQRETAPHTRADQPRFGADIMKNRQNDPPPRDFLF